jgi:hypothetical protein
MFDRGVCKQSFPLSFTPPPEQEEIVISLPLYDAPWSYTRSYPLRALGEHITGPFFLAYKASGVALKLLYDVSIVLPMSFFRCNFEFFCSKSKKDLVLFGSYLVKMIPIVGPYLGIYYDLLTKSTTSDFSPYSQASSVAILPKDQERFSEDALVDRFLNIHDYIDEGRTEYARRSITDFSNELEHSNLAIDPAIEIVCKRLIDWIKQDLAFFRSHPVLVGSRISNDGVVHNVAQFLENIEKNKEQDCLIKLKKLMTLKLNLIQKGVSYFEDQFGDTELKEPLKRDIQKIQNSSPLSVKTILTVYQMQLSLYEKWNFYNEESLE